MSDLDAFRCLRESESRRKFNGTDDEYIKWGIQELKKEMPLITHRQLIAIYRQDQNIGDRIHEAYRNAVQAGLDDSENFDELVAKLKSSVAVLSAPEKKLPEDDELVKAFSVEALKTIDSLALLVEKDGEKGRHINAVTSDVFGRTSDSIDLKPMPPDHPMARLFRKC